MIVISNTSPLINLLAIDQLDLLKKLYGKIIIPQAVYQEITVKGAGQKGSTELEKLNWIEIKLVSDKKLVQALKLELDEGESEVIALAVELKAGLILIDERRGRTVARNLDISCIGLLGVLIEAKQKGLIKFVRPLLDDLISKAGFWINQKLYNRVLEAADEK